MSPAASEPVRKIRVMIADGNEAVRSALKAVLEEDARIQVVASAATGAETLRKATVAKPDVLVMDVRFPDMAASDVIARLSSTGLPLAVLVLSPHATRGSPALEAALQAGAFDFVRRPPNYKDVAQIGRQILTHIFVAAATRSKQLPQRAAGRAAAAGEPGTAGPVPPRDLEAVYLEAGPEHRADLRRILSGIKGKLRPAVLVRTGEQRGAVEELVKQLGGELAVPVYAGHPGDYLVAGRICLLADQSVDIVLERTLSGWIELRTAPPGEGSRALPVADGPSSPVLMRSLGQTFGAALAVVLVGAAPDASVEELAALSALGALTLVTAAEVEGPATARPPGAPAPARVVSLESIVELLAGTGS
jgi:chemotaxis response regulator CheB